MKTHAQNKFEVILWRKGMDYELNSDKSTLYFGTRGTNYREEGYAVTSNHSEYLWEIGLELLKEQ